MALVVKQELLAVVQPQHRMRMRGVFGLLVEINKPPGHSQMNDQRAAVRKSREDVFAASRDLLHARAVQGRRELARRVLGREDRKSTRLNSSHLGISYALVCLQKQNVI